MPVSVKCEGQSCDWRIDPLRIPDRSGFENFDSKPSWKIQNDPRSGRIDPGLTETHFLTAKSPILIIKLKPTSSNSFNSRKTLKKHP